MSHPYITVTGVSYEERPRRSAYNGGEMTMVQVAWAALGLLSVAVFGMFGMFFYLGGRIDATNQRLDGLSESYNSRLDGLSESYNSRLDGLSDLLNARLDSLSTRLDGTNGRIDVLVGELQKLGTHLTARIERLERWAGIPEEQE